MLSGSVRDEDAEHFRIAGADAYIDKSNGLAGFRAAITLIEELWEQRAAGSYRPVTIQENLALRPDA